MTLARTASSVRGQNVPPARRGRLYRLPLRSRGGAVAASASLWRLTHVIVVGGAALDGRATSKSPRRCRCWKYVC